MATSFGHDSSVLEESENLRITGKNAIKSKCSHEKIKYVYCAGFVKTYKTAFHYWLNFNISKISHLLHLIHLQIEHFIPGE